MSSFIDPDHSPTNDDDFTSEPANLTPSSADELRVQHEEKVPKVLIEEQSGGDDSDKVRRCGQQKVIQRNQLLDNFLILKAVHVQQDESTVGRRPLEKKKCVASLEIQQMDNLNAKPMKKKYEFVLVEQHGTTSVTANADEPCNPTIGQMAQTILSQCVGMPCEQLLAQYEIKMELLDRAFEPPDYFDIEQTDFVEHNGRYKVQLSSKVPNRNTNNSGTAAAAAEATNVNLNRGVEAAQCQYDNRQEMVEPLPQSNRGDRHGQAINRGVGAAHCQYDNRQEMVEPLPQTNRSDRHGRTISGSSSVADGRSRSEQKIDRLLLSDAKNPLGNLYDALTDNFLTANDHGICKIANRNNFTKRTPIFIEIGNLDDLRERTKMLHIEQKLSVIGQVALLGDVCPIGQFLQKAVTLQTEHGNSFGIIQIVQKEVHSLKLDDPKVRDSILQQLPMENVTHFVDSACYGTIVAVIVTLSEQKANGKVDISKAKEIFLKFVNGRSLSSVDKSFTTQLNNSVLCSVFVHSSAGKGATDLNFAKGLNFFVEKCSGAVSSKYGYPIAFSLAPLSSIVQNNESVTVTHAIDETHFDWFLLRVQSVNECERSLQKISQSLDEYSNALTNEQLETAQNFLQYIENAGKDIRDSLKQMIINVRMGKTVHREEGMALEKEISDHVENCRNVFGHYEALFGVKKELFRELKQKGVTYIGRCTRQQLDVCFEFNNNPNALHFVLLNNPSSPSIQNQWDSGRFLYICLGLLYTFSVRGKCTFVDFDVLRNSAEENLDEGLPEDIRSLDGYPAIGTRVIKMRGNKLLTNDCVLEDQLKKQCCIARIGNIQRTEAVLDGTQKGTDNCNLPCPFCEGYGGKCPNEDYLWECDDCQETLTFLKRENELITHFFCNCGKTPVEEFTFRCKNVDTHGNEFNHFGSEKSLRKELDRLNNKGVLTLLLLGETGVGKSTLINALVAYLKHSTFEEALQASEIDWLIPARFCTGRYDRDDNWKNIVVKLGEASKEELLESGKSQTKWPNAYVIPSKDGHKVRIIDAPGIGDTDGVKEDDINFDKTLNFISELPELHAICILMKPNQPRLTAAFNYCIDGLLTYLHKNATENIVFMFTYANATSYKMGETGELLKTKLPQIEQAHQVSIPLHRDRIYCLDNEAYAALCLIKKAKIDYSEEEMNKFSRSWRHSEKEFQRLFKYVSTRDAHRTWETVSVNEARRTITDLSEPLALITARIQINLARIEAFENAIKSGEKLLQNAPTLDTVEFRKLVYPRTVCAATRCINVQRTLTGDVEIFMKHCHEQCYLPNITPGQKPNEGLKHCWAMNGTNTCRVCRCVWSEHMHYEYEQIVKTFTLNELKEKLNDEREGLSDSEKVQQQMLEERKTIYAKAAHFCVFLNKWALKPYNDSMEAYIDMCIKHAEKVVVECTGEADQKRHETTMEGLKESLRLYREQKELIDNATAQDSNGPKVITAEDVKKFFDELCKLPFFGKDIRQMFEMKQKSRTEHQKEYSEKNTNFGVNFKANSRRGKVFLVVAEHSLNEEQRKLLKIYEKKHKEMEQLEQAMDRMNMLQQPSGNAANRRESSTSSTPFWHHIPGASFILGPSSSAQNPPSSSNAMPYLQPSFSSAHGSHDRDTTRHTKKQRGWAPWQQ